MPKYQVIQYYQTSEIYYVQAESEDDALSMVNSGKVKPDTVTGSEFCDEIVEEIK